MEIEGEKVPLAAREIFKTAGRIGIWTGLLVILTLLFLSVIERKDPINAVADFEPWRGLISLPILVLTAMILECAILSGSRPWTRSMKFGALVDEDKNCPPEILSEEVLQLIAGCSHLTPTGIRNRALIVLVYCGGLRVSQCLSILPKDLDEEAGTVRVFFEKDCTDKTIRLDAGAFSFIEKWLEVRRQKGINGTAPLICTLKGKPIDRSYGRRLFQQLARKPEQEKPRCDLPKIRTLRNPSSSIPTPRRTGYTASSSINQSLLRAKAILENMPHLSGQKPS